MSNQRYPEEFKIKVVKQVIERGLPVADVAARLGGWASVTGVSSRRTSPFAYGAASLE